MKYFLARFTTRAVCCGNTLCEVDKSSTLCNSYPAYLVTQLVIRAKTPYNLQSNNVAKQLRLSNVALLLGLNETQRIKMYELRVRMNIIQLEFSSLSSKLNANFSLLKRCCMKSHGFRNLKSLVFVFRVNRLCSCSFGVFLFFTVNYHFQVSCNLNGHSQLA